MIISSIIAYKLKQKYDRQQAANNANGNNTNANNGNVNNANSNSLENFQGGSIAAPLIIFIVFAVLGLFAFIITICSLVKASKICGDQSTTQVLLILFIPFYALYFLFAGKSICKDNYRSHNNRRPIRRR
jgi:hypothetical protein